MGGGGINLFKFTCTMTFLSNVILILLGVQLNIHNPTCSLSIATFICLESNLL